MPGIVLVPPTDEPFLVAARPLQARRVETQIRNRRKRYLEINPSYFSHELESADPLLYDRLVRRWQNTDERSAERQRGGFSGVLQRDMQRSQARLDAVQSGAQVQLRQGQGGEMTADVMDDDDNEDATNTREDDWQRWKSAMERRFVTGNDDDFNYGAVDSNDAYDDSAEASRDREAAYFDAMEPEFQVPNGRHLTGETGIQDY